MCTIMLYPESLGAQLRSRSETRRQVDDLMEYDRERAAGRHPFPPVFDPESRERRRRHLAELKARGISPEWHPSENAFQRAIEGDGNVYVWLDNWCFGNSPKGFYYVRFILAMKDPFSTTYNNPVLIVQKRKLRPDQVDFMERKCEETRRIWEKGRNSR